MSLGNLRRAAHLRQRRRACHTFSRKFSQCLPLGKLRRLVHVPSEMCFPIANTRRRAFPNACATAANMCLRFRGTPRAFTSLRVFASGEHSSGCGDGIDFRSDVVSRFYVGAQAETARHGYYYASAVGRN